MQLVRRVNRPVKPLFDNFFNDDFFRWVEPAVAARNVNVPAVNVKETEDQYDLELAAPGMEKSDFNIEVDKDILTISSEVKREKEEKDGDNWTRKEFSYNAFKRSFTLPETVAADKIEASYINGVLKLTLPKKEEAKPQPARTIEIA